ncbi:MAG: acyloxyacyl hydrolase [Alphaproteobacteria bacterium]
MGNPTPIPRLALAMLVQALVAATIAATAARADDPAFVAVGVGGFDINDNETTFQGRVEYRAERRFALFKPMAGVMVTGEGGVYGYGGVLIDLYFGRRWVVTPSFAAGAYADGGGKDLGGTLEFRSAIELSYRLDDRARLGLAFDHISNASLYDANPGTESLVLIYAIPLD